MSQTLRLALLASDTPRAQEAAEAYRARESFVSVEDAEAVIVLGGDGFMLQTLHHMLDTGRVLPAYGINQGTIGFLMNHPRGNRTLAERVARARRIAVAPLEMTATFAGPPADQPASAMARSMKSCPRPVRAIKSPKRTK